MGRKLEKGKPKPSAKKVGNRTKLQPAYSKQIERILKNIPNKDDQVTMIEYIKDLNLIITKQKH